MLMRTDPFHELDRLTQQLLGTSTHPTVMPLDAWRDGDTFRLEFDLPGVDQNSISLDVERNALTIRAERPVVESSGEQLAAERPRGVFSRQLILGDNLDLDKITAVYQDGVLRLEIPVAEAAKPRKIPIQTSQNSNQDAKVISA
ncbi:MAG: Hsp20 family protein [Microlunatus sp.]|nr:Hsp20 family protein [Microlunatus sp.]